MQVIENASYKEVQGRPMLVVDRGQRNVDPMSNPSWPGVSQQPKTPRCFYGLQFETVIWIFMSGFLAVLAICLGAVLGSELQKCRNLKYFKPLTLSQSD